MVAACRPLALQAARQLIHIVYLVDRHTLVGEPQDRVVEVGVGVALRPHHLADAIVAPAGPAVGGEHHRGLVTIAIQCRVDVLRPNQRIAHERAPQRVDVVDGAGDVLRRTERLELREPDVHLGRRFRAGRVLELHPDAVDGEFLEILADDPRRRDQAHAASRNVLADRLVHVAVGAARQQDAVLEEQAPVHGIAGVDVLRHRVLQESHGRDDRYPAASDIGLVDHTACTAEMITVRMRVDHRDDRPLAELLVDERKGSSGRLLRRQRVDDDPARIAFDDAEVGDVEAADLVEPARHDLVEAVGHVQHRLALQRRMDAVELPVLQQEIVARHIPGDVTAVGLDLPVRRRRDEAALRLLEITRVLERQRGADAVVQFDRVFRRRLALRIEVPGLHCAGVGQDPVGTGGQHRARHQEGSHGQRDRAGKASGTMDHGRLLMKDRCGTCHETRARHPMHRPGGCHWPGSMLPRPSTTGARRHRRIGCRPGSRSPAAPRH